MDWETEFRTEAVTLAGGYRCKLTTDERNSWHEFIEKHPARLAQVICTANVVRASHQGTESCLFQYVEDERLALATLYEAGKQWFLELKLERALAKEETEK